MVFKHHMDQAIRSGKKITLRSYLLQEKGEAKLEMIVEKILTHLDREDLFGPVYAAVRELVQNASKANLKRILFNDMSLNPLSEEDYKLGMEVFRKCIVESKLGQYRIRIKERHLYFTVTFEFDRKVLIATVKNRFPLFPAEEIRIREKFIFARNMDNLYDFFLTYGDMAEGAGMGIAMVEILLTQAGLDAHNFTIFTDGTSSETVARIIVPVSEDYVSTRRQFDQERERLGITAEEMRDRVKDGSCHLTIR